MCSFFKKTYKTNYFKILSMENLMQKEKNINWNFKHLVISGGAFIGLVYFGILKTLLEKRVLNIDKLESIFATSVGTILSVLLSLDYSIGDIEDYIINRPWHKLFKFDLETFFNGIYQGGFFDKEKFLELIKPFILGKDLSLEITMEEFSEITKKDFHFFSVKYNTMELVDISSKTHGKLKLLDVVYASCCIPILFVPCKIENDVFIDGAVFKNYPLYQCIEYTNESDCILGIYNKSDKTETDCYEKTQYKLFDFIIDLMLKMWKLIKNKPTKEETNLKNQIRVKKENSFKLMMHCIESKNTRQLLIDEGVQIANDYIKLSTNE